MRCAMLFWTCLWTLVCAAAPAQDADRALASMVRIWGTRSGTLMQGSGFVVAIGRGSATIVTAAHVIEGTRFAVEFAASRGDTSSWTNTMP